MKLIVNIMFVIILCTPRVALTTCIQGDCMNGQGTYILPDGSKYVGEFREGVRYGKGSMTYPDGTRYEGNWQNDLPNGQGVKTLIDGMRYSGKFRNGLMYGSSTAIMPDGSMLKIKWSNAPPLQEEDNGPDTEIKSVEDEKEEAVTTTPENIRKSPAIEPLISVRHRENSSQGLAAGEGNPSREPDHSTEAPVQTAQEDTSVDEAAIKDMEPEDTVIASQPAKADKIKYEAVVSVENVDGPGPEEVVPQNFVTTGAVEYASIAVGANIRSGASLTSKVLRSVPPGYPVVVLQKQADWFLVKDYRGRKGWVYASLVDEPGTAIIKVFKGNLRRGPSLQDDIIVQLDHGTVVSVLARNGEWMKVSDSEELTGWLHSKVIWPAAETDAR